MPSTTPPASRWWRSTTRSRKAARRPARCRSACSARCRPSDAYTRDLDKAKDYLAKCKYKPDDFTLELSWVGEVPLEERFALLMQANFAEIGIKSEVKKIPWALFSEQATKPENTPNISQVFVNTVTGDPDTLIYGMYHSSAAGTWQSPEYLKDAKVDELLDKGRTVAVGRRARRRSTPSSASGCASWRRPSSPMTRRRCSRRASASRCRRCPTRARRSG